MNKLAIPAVLAATVLIAGIFAFMPVEKATTVHDQIIAALSGQLAGANLERIQQHIDMEDDGSSVTWTQLITFDRISGEGAYQIEKLFLCDLETGDNSLDISYDIETNLIDENSGSGQPSFMSSADDSDPRDLDIESNFSSEKCVDILSLANDVDTTHSNTDTAERVQLGGDQDNNVVLRMRGGCDNNNTDTDGAYLVAYIVGLESADQFNIDDETEVNDTTSLTGCGPE